MLWKHEREGRTVRQMSQRRDIEYTNSEEFREYGHDSTFSMPVMSFEAIF